MRKLTLVIVSLWLLLPAFTSSAAGFTNQFNSGFDFVARGIIGNTNWDGVYLDYGDILNGNAGGDGNGVTLQANETSSPGTLTVQTSDSSWAGPGDDGFFVYKVIAGDFDVSVKTVPPWNVQPYVFGGLLVRGWNTNNSGAPASFTGSPSENWLALWRFQEFGVNLIREATNGIDFQASFPETNSDTNSARYFRITRTGDVFAFYWKTNGPDAWTLITNATAAGGYVPATGTLARPDWHDRPVQVGIAEGTYSVDSPVERFADFELSGPNVTFPVMPPAPSGLQATANSSSGGFTFSWTPGNPGDGSLVVMRALGNIQHNPVNGLTYNFDSAFGDTNACLGGSNEFVVYNGHNSSVTVSNLGGNYLWYTVAVYEYSGSGSSTVYNTASPATHLITGPLPITGVAFSLSPTNIPVGGIARAKLLVTYGFNPSNVVVSSDPSIIWSSSDPTVATVETNGLVNGVGFGSASITGALKDFQASATVTVHAPAFADDFTVARNYLTGGLVGSAWDGLYLNFGDMPDGSAGSDGAGFTTVLNSRITSTNGLSLSSCQSDWNDSADDGPFLYKLAPGSINAVSGDFQAVTHVFSEGALSFQAAGIMARLFRPDGGPGPGGTENHVDYWKVQGPFQETWEVRTQNGVSTGVATGSNPASIWLLLQRINSTNFYFYKKAASNGSWMFVTNTVLAAASNSAPMQVGLAQQTLSTNTGQAVFDHFMLDAAGIVTPFTPPPPAGNVTETINVDGTITISYTVGTNADGTAVGSVVMMHAGGPVTKQPYTGMSLPGNPSFGDPNTDLGGGNFVVYRSPDGSSQTNQSVTVSNLSFGMTYYVVVYTYVGDGPTSTYNEIGSVPGPPNRVIGITATVPPIPLNGIGLLQVVGDFSSGPPQLIAPTNTEVISGNTNVVKVLDGIVTGVGPGTTTLTVMYSSESTYPLMFYDFCNVTVHPPTFSDDFGTSHDYLANGVAGSGWGGVYAYPGSTIPGSSYTSSGSATTYSADANITSNGVLTVVNENGGWEFNQNDGFFLFKYVPGDFQMAVHITTPLLDTNGNAIALYNYPGLLARAYSVSNSTLGAPAGGTNGEDWVSWGRFDEFGIGTRAEMTINNGTTRPASTDVGSDQRWLLMVRQNGTGFRFYQRSGATDPWQLAPAGQAFNIAQFAGVPMQVGIMEGGFDSGNSVTGQFDHFMLDFTTSGLQLQMINLGNGTVMLSWPADPNAQLESTSSLNPANWQPVGGTPVLGNDGRFRLSVPIAAGGQYFRLRN